jgi:hypothetical protein
MSEKEQKNAGGKLMCSACGKPAKRLLSPPLPPKHSKQFKAEGLLCETCVANLEEEYAQETPESGDNDEL